LPCTFCRQIGLACDDKPLPAGENAKPRGGNGKREKRWKESWKRTTAQEINTAGAISVSGRLSHIRTYSSSPGRLRSALRRTSRTTSERVVSGSTMRNTRRHKLKPKPTPRSVVNNFDVPLVVLFRTKFRSLFSGTAEIGPQDVEEAVEFDGEIAKKLEEFVMRICALIGNHRRNFG
jgi:hypothetical protein